MYTNVGAEELHPKGTYVGIHGEPDDMWVNGEQWNKTKWLQGSTGTAK